MFLHGYGDSRAGALPWALAWHAAGLGVILPDLRAHGQTGGKMAGGGAWEVDDLHRLIDAARSRHGEALGPLFVAGLSFGGFVAAGCVADRDDVAGLVVDSPILAWPDAATRWRRLFSLPPPGGDRLRLAMVERVYSLDFSKLDTIEFAVPRGLPDPGDPAAARRADRRRRCRPHRVRRDLRLASRRGPQPPAARLPGRVCAASSTGCSPLLVRPL